MHRRAVEHPVRSAAADAAACQARPLGAIGSDERVACAALRQSLQAKAGPAGQDHGLAHRRRLAVMPPPRRAPGRTEHKAAGRCNVPSAEAGAELRAAAKARCGHRGRRDEVARLAAASRRLRNWPDVRGVLKLTPGQRARILSNGTAAAPQDAPAAVKRAIAAANRIHTSYYRAERPEYLNRLYPWYDCSASTAYVLYHAGLNGTGVTVGGTDAGNGITLEDYGEPGPGRWISVYGNSTHAFIVIAGWRSTPPTSAARTSPPAQDPAGAQTPPETSPTACNTSSATHPDCDA